MINVSLQHQAELQTPFDS